MITLTNVRLCVDDTCVILTSTQLMAVCCLQNLNHFRIYENVNVN